MDIDHCLVTEAFPRIVFLDSVRDLGIILDQELSLSLHVNQFTRSSYCYRLHQLWFISCSLSYDAAITFMHGFIICRLDPLLVDLSGFAPCSSHSPLPGSPFCFSSYWMHPKLCLCMACCIDFQLPRVSPIGWLCWSGDAFFVVPGIPM